MSKIDFEVEETISTSKGVFEVVASNEHVEGDYAYHTYTIRSKKELDTARDAQAKREAEEVERQKQLAADAKAEEDRVAKLHEETRDPNALAAADQARLDALQAGGAQ